MVAIVSRRWDVERGEQGGPVTNSSFRRDLKDADEGRKHE